MLSNAAAYAAAAIESIDWAGHRERVTETAAGVIESTKSRFLPDSFVTPSECPYSKVPFREKVPLDTRIKMSAELKAANPTSVIVVIEHGPNCRFAGVYVSKLRYIVQGSTTLGMFRAIILRKYACGVGQTQTFWLSVAPPVKRRGVPPSTDYSGLMISQPTMTLSEIAEKYKDPADGILYLVIDVENTFGGDGPHLFIRR